jgi:hypothetical protein
LPHLDLVDQVGLLFRLLFLYLEYQDRLHRYRLDLE